MIRTRVLKQKCFFHIRKHLAKIIQTFPLIETQKTAKFSLFIMARAFAPMLHLFSGGKKHFRKKHKYFHSAALCLSLM
jgi:hypothetical protein